ncbi:MAG: winged helix-turn-helix transcriptional regulator [Bdellovibrionales bacterium]|nr:winged helix-turn-helix transcriptional regulator [Bdellovibrionales bacterium]
MPGRLIVAKKIAHFLGVLAHPHRIRMIEELAIEKRDVRGLSDLLSLPQSTISQHLGHLKQLGLVEGSREGKHVVYSLTKVWVARWLLETLRFFDEDDRDAKSLKVALAYARKAWKGSESLGS